MNCATARLSTVIKGSSCFEITKSFWVVFSKVKFQAEIPYMEQLLLCTRHPHEKPRREFIDISSNEEYDTCNQCRQEKQEISRARRQRLQEMEDELERVLTLEDLEIEGGIQGKCLIGRKFLIYTRSSTRSSTTGSSRRTSDLQWRSPTPQNLS